ncbi:MAG: 16S rRNA (cytidine(1402)-2'-O)-methyltransferase, partial [Pseudorhodoplanes sp.]|nr:16S rRNA (cytidine(1402)-2'-O)-methyltransferase [Pseudorhodoplanes sp.]
HYAEGGETRGEIVIVIHPPGQNEMLPDAEQLDAMITEGLATASVKDVASEVAAMTGLPRRDIYRRALVLAKER